MTFEFTLALNGSGSLKVAPFGMQTRVRLTSPFPDPSFQGAFLPAQRKVTANGFEADWQVSYYGRGYPQQWSDATGNSLPGDTVAASLFGVGMVRCWTATATWNARSSTASCFWRSFSPRSSSSKYAC
jgi:inner membrane protein